MVRDRIESNKLCMIPAPEALVCSESYPSLTLHLTLIGKSTDSEFFGNGGVVDSSRLSYHTRVH